MREKGVYRFIEMKKLLVLIAFLLPLNLFGGWTLQESGVDGTLRDVHFVDTSHGWIAAGSEGNKGLILRTTNGGGNWDKVYTDTSQDLYAVGFFDSLEGWAGGCKYYSYGPPWPEDGSYSILLHSIDGGKTWSSEESKNCSLANHLLSSTHEKIDDICIIDSTYGFYMENGYRSTSDMYGFWTVFRSLDGKHGWGISRGMSYGVHGLGFCTDSLHGWFELYDNDRVSFSLFYTDKGLESLSAISELSYPSSDMVFVDTLHGWRVGGKIFHTADGGTTWVEQASGVTSCLHTVDFLDSLNGWAAGNNGTIIRTRDGGNNWIREHTPISSKINSICFIDTSHGWAVSDNGEILCTKLYSPYSSGKEKELWVKPNPFSSVVGIEYLVASKKYISLKIYDVMGRVVKVLVDGEVYSGYHKVEWNAREFPSGIYFASFVAPNHKTTKKLILTK